MSSSYEYHLLEKISKLYEASSINLGCVYVLACQHILEPQAKMFDLIASFGIPKENIRIFGKIYSTNNEVLTELKEKGFDVGEPVFDPSVSFDVEHAGICE